MAFGGQRTAAVSPAGVIFHTTLEKLSSPQISWGSTQENEQSVYIVLYWLQYLSKTVLSNAGFNLFSPFTDLDISFHCSGEPPLGHQDKTGHQKMAHNTPSVSAGSPRHRSWYNLPTMTRAATCHPLLECIRHENMRHKCKRHSHNMHSMNIEIQT